MAAPPVKETSSATKSVYPEKRDQSALKNFLLKKKKKKTVIDSLGKGSPETNSVDVWIKKGWE